MDQCLGDSLIYRGIWSDRRTPTSTLEWLFSTASIGNLLQIGAITLLSHAAGRWKVFGREEKEGNDDLTTSRKHTDGLEGSLYDCLVLYRAYSGPQSLRLDDKDWKDTKIVPAGPFCPEPVQYMDDQSAIQLIPSRYRSSLSLIHFGVNTWRWLRTTMVLEWAASRKICAGLVWVGILTLHQNQQYHHQWLGCMGTKI